MSPGSDAPACAAVIGKLYHDAYRVDQLEPEIPTDGLPWISQPPTASASPAPVAVNPTAAGVSVRTSLGQMRDYNLQMTAKKIEAAKVFAPKAAPQAAPPPAPKAPFDVWTSVDVQGYEDAGDQATRAGVGADYKLTSKATVGVSAQIGETKIATAAQEDQKFAAYMAFRATPAFTIDARTEWSETAAVLGATATEKSSISVAPRLGKAYALDHGKTIEPFVTYKREIDLGSTALDSTASAFSTTQSAGGGVTYAKPDAYSLSVTTDFENVGASEPASVNSKLQLKLSIR